MPDGSEVQSVLFDIKTWTIARAKKWLAENDFTSRKVDKGEDGEYYRFRQTDPDKYKEKRTISTETSGVKFIIGFKAGKRKKLYKGEINFDVIEELMTSFDYEDSVKDSIILMLKGFDVNQIKLINNVLSMLIEDVGENELKKQESERGINKKAQEARSKRYKIGIKEGGNVTKPSKWSSVPDGEWGDPVNYRYPMPDASHTRNAASRWGDPKNREQYNSNEQSIISGRIDKRKKHFEIGEFKKKVSLINKSVDEERRLVYGVVIEPGLIDTDNQWTDETEIERACHNFMKFFQESGTDHIFSNGKLRIVENYIAPANFLMNDVMVKKGSWVLCHYVGDDDIWERIKDGDLNGYSFEGMGILSSEKPKG